MRQIKKMGQVFADPSILLAEIELVDFKEKTVLEIGAGDGRLTELLSQKAKKVICFEKDKRFCNLLKNKFKDKNVLVMCGDFLKFPPNKIDYVFGNVPYNISSKILFHLEKFEFKKAVLMFQKEFVLRMTAEEDTKNYGRLSVMAQYFFNINIEYVVDKKMFKPKPKVDSIIITLEKTNRKIDKNLSRIINYLFQHKKKSLKKALLASYKKQKTIKELIKTLEEPNKRVFKFTIEEILEISKKVYEWEKKDYFSIGEKKKENY